MSGNVDYRAIDILLVEDNPGDVRLTQETLADAKVRNRLHVVGTGEDALDYLARRSAYSGVPRPDLILLDLNLPGTSGLEVLRGIKADPGLKTIPVVVLTTSQAEEDVVKAYKLFANCYITKPVDLEQFSKVVRSIEDFWFTIVKLPRV